MATPTTQSRPNIAVVGLQVASGILLTYPLTVTDTVFKTSYQPIAEIGKSSSPVLIENTWQAAQRVANKDGWVGLLRGAVPFFGYTLLYSAGFESFYQIYSRLPIQSTPLGFVAARDFAVAAWRAVLQPFSTLLTRFIVRPEARRSVPGPLAFDPIAIWNATTDEEERQRPWTLFKPSIAGLELVAALTANVANSLVIVPVTEIFYAFAHRGPQHLSSDEWKSIGTLSVVAATGVAVRFVNIAFETVSKRLQAQSSGSNSATSAAKQAVGGALSIADPSAVSVLRPAPYKGPIDAFQRIIDEEGFQGLFHGWGVQIGGTVAAAAATVGLAKFGGRL